MQNSLTSTLQKERQDITRNKDLGHPFLANHNATLSINHLDDPSKFHVDRSGKECGCNEKEDTLYDIGTQGPVWCFI